MGANINRVIAAQAKRVQIREQRLSAWELYRLPTLGSSVVIVRENVSKSVLGAVIGVSLHRWLEKANATARDPVAFMVAGGGSRSCGISAAGLDARKAPQFEPPIPRTRDYEPNELGENCEGSRPVAVQKPSPRFWALSFCSRRLAAE